MDRLQNYKKKYIIPLKNKELSKLDVNQWKYSSVINKYTIEKSLQMSTTLNKIIALYRIKDLTNNNIVNYNIAYLHNTDNISIKQIIPSGSIETWSDYRYNLLNYINFTTFLSQNIEIMQIYEYIQSYFKDVFIERKLELNIEYLGEYNKKTKIICEPLKIQFFCIAWFNFYYDYVLEKLSNNLNVIFTKIMKSYKKEDLIFFKSLLKKFNTNDIEILNYICHNNIVNSSFHKTKELVINLNDANQLGQKVVLLKLEESIQKYDLRFNPWLELVINKKVSDLVINNISNGFALSGSEFLIKLDKDNNTLFDTEGYHEIKYISDISKKIANLLLQAKVYTEYTDTNFKIDEFLNIIVSKLKKTVKYKNNFDRLRRYLVSDIKHVTHDLVMSDVALNLTTEYLGKTFYDKLIESHKEIYIFSTENYNNFKKYMFELCYNLYCLNTKVHIIHGDLHMNNIIINSLFYKKIEPCIKDSKILFVIDDNKYIFDNNFYNLCIIDFNNAIINVDYFKSDQQSKLLEMHVDYLIKYLCYLKPEYNEFSQELYRNIPYHFDEYFRVLTSLDLYYITSGILDNLKEFKKNNKSIKIGSKSLKLVNDLHKSADYYLTTILQKLLNSTDSNSDSKNQIDEWPMLNIIKDIFCDSRYTDDQIQKITDVIVYH